VCRYRLCYNCHLNWRSKWDSWLHTESWLRQSLTPRMIWMHNCHFNTNMRQAFFPVSSFGKSGVDIFWCMKIFNVCVGVDIFVKIDGCVGNWSYIHELEEWNLRWEEEYVCKYDFTAVIALAVTWVFPISLTAKAWVLSQVSLCGVCDRKLALLWVSPSTSIFLSCFITPVLQPYYRGCGMVVISSRSSNGSGL